MNTRVSPCFFRKHLRSLGWASCLSLAGIGLQCLPSSAAQLTVATIADSGPLSLRAAIDSAQDGDVITFAIAGTITNFNGEFLITKNLTIAGPGATNLALSGNYSNRLFNIPAGVSVAISGLTIKEGKSADGAASTALLVPGEAGADGGGIYNAGTLNLTNCVISNCRTGQGGYGYNYSGSGVSGSAGGPGGNGAGIYNAGILTLASCNLASNTNGNGGFGGLASSGSFGTSGGAGGPGGSGAGIYNTGDALVMCCDLRANYAGDGAIGNVGGYGSASIGNGGDGGAGGNGGGICNFGTLTVLASSLTSCRGGLGGAGSLTQRPMSSRTVAGAGGNGGSGGHGGGIYDVGTMTANNCTFATCKSGKGGAGGAGGAGAPGGGALGAPTSGGKGGKGGAGGSGGAICALNLTDLTALTITACTAGSGGAGGVGGDGGYASGTTSTNGGDGGNGGDAGAGAVCSSDVFPSISLRNVLAAANYSGSGGVGGAGGRASGGFYPGTPGRPGTSGHYSPGPDLGGSFTSLGHNLVGSGLGSTGVTAGSQDDLVGGTTPINPLLNPAWFNGTSGTRTCSLKPGSPAFDAGDDILMDAPFNLTNDQRGRPRKSGLHVDIGAFEVQVASEPISITGSGREPDGSFRIAFSNTPAATFTLLATTNTSLSLSNWSIVGTVPELAPGQFQFIDPAAKTGATRLYRLRWP